jgi:hypothetical protein
VIVEGSSDVGLFWLTAALYYERHGTHILGDQLSVLAAGLGNDGGVDGVNRRLNAARQIADADRGPDGGRRFQFVGLYDNDHAGRRAIEAACSFDPRLRLYNDLFLLHPVMPLANGVGYAELKRLFATQNAPFKDLDWEIEDCISERILTEFDKTEPRAILRTHECAGRKHYELRREGKFRLHEYAKKQADLEDMVEVVKLIRALRDYFRLRVDHIVC